jgi:DNA-binding transcriptional ArsR family regulator
MDEKQIESELRGKTLKVYWYLLEHSAESSVGVREVQRALGFSSPRLAAYHLEKLEELGLVENRCGEYFLIKEIRVGVMKHFLKLGRFLLPRYFFYATMFTTFLIYIVVGFEEANAYSVFALILSVLSSVIFWYETIRMWRQKP